MSRARAVLAGPLSRLAGLKLYLFSGALTLAGVALVAALAQVQIRLPFTPVPVTGQTLGVYLLAFFLGPRLGAASMGLYLLVGALGLPVFAGGRAGLAGGPTAGYLVGMAVAVVAMGALVRLGAARGFWRTYLVCLVGSVCVFGAGLWQLSHFVPANQLLTAGLWPFVPGDVVKSVLAATTVTLANHSSQVRE